MKNYKQILIILTAFVYIFCLKQVVFALEPGTLLYRTSSNGEMYGYSSKELIKEKNGIMTNIYPGHVAIYIGKEDGVDYVVEALSSGIVKTPAKYFVNEALGEELVAAKLPRLATPWQRARAVALAKYLASADLAYDFDFSAQKGPWSGDWTCVGLTEKLYESANASNPERLGALEYDYRYYAVNITSDGYDSDSYYNDQGDCFSSRREYSKIARRKNTILPAPEIIGYNAGKEYNGNRYIFLPYTQALQSSLRDVPVDIQLSSSFEDRQVRGKVNNIGIILQWSLINNPISSIKKIATSLSSGLGQIINDKSKTDELLWAEQDLPDNTNDTAKLVSEKTKIIPSTSLQAEVNPSINHESSPIEQNITTPGPKISETKEDKKQTQPSADVFSAVRVDNSENETVKTNSSKNVSIPVETTSEESKSDVQVASNRMDDKNVALWTPLINKINQTTPTNTSNASVTASTSTPATTSTLTTTTEDPLTLLISRIYVQGDVSIPENTEPLFGKLFGKIFNKI